MNRILIMLALILTISCKEDTKSTTSPTEKSEVSMNPVVKEYPENLSEVFEAHGGLPAWQKERTMSFTMPKDEGDETHTIDLNKRYEKIVTPNYSMGYDGNDFWLADEKELYKSDPIFYHNLMFYFYAMPFVLADDGIIYSETEALEFEERIYPGVRIRYGDGVGVSPKDEYYLHYNSETGQMEWLGYTVTYKSGEKSDNIKWIRYTDWQELDGLLLPKTLTWYTMEHGKVGKARNSRSFENVTLSDTVQPDTFYAVPENGKIVEKQ